MIYPALTLPAEDAKTAAEAKRDLGHARVHPLAPCSPNGTGNARTARITIMAPIIPPLTAPPWSDTHFIMQGDSQSTSSPFREQLFRAVRLNLPIEVMRLLDEGAEVNCIDHHGNTPLHIAVGRGNEEITKILLQNGADATRRNFNFRTPVEVAERCGREEITRLLLGDAGTAQQGNSARQILAGRVKTRNLMRQR